MELNHLGELYQNYRTEHVFFGQPANLYQPMQYIMDLGGKRARPLLVLASAVAAGADPASALPLAHAIEVFHNFSLVHDDIMDNAPSRRGQPTVHEKWNIPTAILAGDNMLVDAVRCITRYNGPHKEAILDLFLRTASEVCEGQQLDMDFANRKDVGVAEYLEMIRLKTAVLLGCSASCGAMSGHASAEKAKHYYDFAIALGLAFQLDDDWLDTFGDPDKTGKVAGGDIAEGKKTWLYIAAADRGYHVQELYQVKDPEERVFLVSTLFREKGLDEELKSLSASYADQAAGILLQLAASGEQTRLLADLSVMLGQRQH